MDSEETREIAIWNRRAKDYDKLTWTKNDKYLNELIDILDFTNKIILDVGTGTGTVASAIKLKYPTSEITGIDISKEMLQIANDKVNSVDFKLMNATKMDFDNNLFDVSIARMAIHHLVDGMQVAINEMSRVTKRGGFVLVSEGIPPSHNVIQWYEMMFSKKEKRKALTPYFVFEMFTNALLGDIQQFYHRVNDFSIKNWLENSGLEKEIQDEIFQLHVNAPQIVKERYNMRLSENDCLIDVWFLTTLGRVSES